MAGTVQLPKISSGFLGPQLKFERYGLTTVSHSEPVIYLTDDKPETEVIMSVPLGTRITIKLLSYGPNNKDVTDFVLMRALGDKYLFLIRPPMTGFFKFQIYALPSSEAGPAMIGVYNYLVHCPVPSGTPAFPKQYPPWKAGCYLYEPISLPSGCQEKDVKFKMMIPNAKDVQVKVDQVWNPLQQMDPGVFEGLVNLGLGHAPGTKAKVNVNFAGGTYQTLLEYTL